MFPISVSPGGAELPPKATALLESLRAMGYTPATALADIVDNSIAASATLVRIITNFGEAPTVAIVDNGIGMAENSLKEAMRFGSSDPRESRHGADLGRFGLGLKTASLSQCRRFTVASLNQGHLSLARWDLDECHSRNKWWLSIPAPDELPEGVLPMLREQGQGSAVVWEKLDRLAEFGGERSVLEAVDHIALVFHRYLAGEFGEPLRILVNERPMPVVDPFLEGHTRGQTLHAESISIEGCEVKISPFVLPFPAKLKPGEIARLGGRDSLKVSHGFYVYRGGRLMVPGGWFRIVPADDLLRLARIRIDVPVALDHIWKVDIRKTVAEPPQALRPHLKRIVGDVTGRSRRVYQYKGLPAATDNIVPIWQRVDLRDKGAAWRINRDHPLISALVSRAASLRPETVLGFLENSLPVQDIHLHTANDQPVAAAAELDPAELEDLARRIVGAFADDAKTVSKILHNLAKTEPFCSYPDMTEQIVERIRNEK